MNPSGPNNVVQWVHNSGETVMSNMGYHNGRLLIEKDGHYYLYSKVTLNAAEECSLIQHKVMKETKAYDQAIELMRSKRFVGATPYFLPLLLHIISQLFTCVPPVQLGFCVCKSKMKSEQSSLCSDKYPL